MTHTNGNDWPRKRLSIDDVCDDAAMGYDAAPRMVDAEYRLSELAQDIMAQGYGVELNGEKLVKKIDEEALNDN